MIRALRRALRLIASPGEEWKRIAQESPTPFTTLVRFVVPLACIPAVSWGLCLYLFGRGVPSQNLPNSGALPDFIQGALVAFCGSVVSVFLLAGAVMLLAPVFGRPRLWSRSFQVAGFSSAPVLVAGVVLVVPNLAFALMVAGLHGFYLLHGGVRDMLGVKADDAAEYVALVMIVFLVASSILGAGIAMLGVG